MVDICLPCSPISPKRPAKNTQIPPQDYCQCCPKLFANLIESITGIATCMARKERLQEILRSWGPKLSVPEVYWKHHIDYGYRAPWNSFRSTFFSLFSM